MGRLGWLAGGVWGVFGDFEVVLGGFAAVFGSFCRLGAFVWALFGRLLVALRLILGTLWRHLHDYWQLSMKFGTSCLKKADLLQTWVFLV